MCALDKWRDGKEKESKKGSLARQRTRTGFRRGN